MSTIYKYYLGKNNNSDAIRASLDDLLFQKRAEMTVSSSMKKHVDLLSKQIDTINKRSFEFSNFSTIYFQEEYLSFNEASLLLIGINPDVLSFNHFKHFNLTSYTDTDYLSSFMANRVKDIRTLQKLFFTNDKQVVETKRLIKKTMSLGYFSRELFTPKSANHRHNTKSYNLDLTKDALINLLLERARSTPDSATSIAMQLHKKIHTKLIAYNNKGDKPNADTIRKYIGEIINHNDWQFQPESIKSQITVKS